MTNISHLYTSKQHRVGALVIRAGVVLTSAGAAVHNKSELDSARLEMRLKVLGNVNVCVKN